MLRRGTLQSKLFPILVCWFLHEWSQFRIPSVVREVPGLVSEIATGKSGNPTYAPLCAVKSDDALSAIQRAKTAECKQMIADFACSHEKGEAVPKSLVNTCPGDDFEIGDYLGCYYDNKTDPVLKHGKDFENNTISSCIRTCTTAGKMYAGVIRANECSCGDSLSQLVNRNESLCNMSCPGDPALICGGESAVSVYTTGLSDRKNFYWVSPVEGESWGAVKIAFFLTFNGRQIRQVKQLLRNIYSPNHLYLIHVEKRAHMLYKELVYLEEKYSNIKLQKERIRGNWGSPSLLHGIRNGIREMLKMGEWDYWINLSESCFPTEYIGDLEDFLGANRGLSFLASPVENPFDSLKSQGLSKAFVECDGYLYSVGSKDLPEGIRMDFGSDWFAFHRDFAEFVVDSDDPLIRGLEKLFNNSYLAPESFFHFAMQNSHLCNRVSNSNLRIVRWSGKKTEGQCHCNIYADACGCSPISYRRESLYELVDGKPFDTHFARKFDATLSQWPITTLEERVLDPWPAGTPGVYSYWEPLFLRGNDEQSELSAHVFELSKLAISENKNLATVSLRDVEAVHSFYDKDVYQGFLVKVGLDHSSASLEFYFKPNRKFSKVPDASLEGSKLHNLKVGEDYIKKEAVMQNRATYINSESKLTLEHRWLPSASRINVTFYWANPFGDVIYKINETTKNDTEVHSTSLNNSKPLIPGEWTVIAVEDGQIAGYIEFPVFPSNNYKGDLERSSPLESASMVGSVTSFVTNRINEKASFESVEKLNLYLMKKYYTLEGLCVSECGFLDCLTFSELKLCEQTNWSSLSPDPKSDF